MTAWLAARRDPLFLVLCGEAALLFAILLAAGMLAGELAPDTASYFLTGEPGTPWGEIRHPLYSWMTAWLGGSSTTTGAVALVQAMLHLAASFVLYAGARAGGIRPIGAFALATAALLSQSGLYHLRVLLPESPATSCLLAAFGLTLAASRSSSAFRRLIVPIMLLAGTAYLLRPSHLPAIAVVPVLYWLFAWRFGQRPTLRAALLMLALAVPFLAQSAIRLKAVGDFNVTSYGGFQMSPLAGFMLTPEIVARLPERVQPTARAILTARERAEADGSLPRTPLNSAGERSFPSAALGYFDIYARSYDILLFSDIVLLRQPGETWVAFNRRLMEFSLATVTAAPKQWLAWIGGATTRLVGRAIVTNATMLAAGLLLFVAGALAALRRRPLGPACEGIGAVCAVALAWFACTAPLTVLVTFPASRYIDTAALLLPAILLALALNLRTRVAQ
jgi:hypothetical protein